MRFKQIRIKNFQALKDITLDLGNVTVIKGASDVGKTAVARAFGALLSNNFDPAFAHKGDYPFGIAIATETDVVIGRRTTKGVEYKVGTTVFSKTAKQVPKEVADALGIREYSIEQDQGLLFQVQSQFDSPFLVGDPPSFISKVLGRISNLNIVMAAMRNMYADQIKVRQEINFLTTKKADLTSSKRNFVNLQQEEALFNTAASVQKTIEDSFVFIESTRGILVELEAIDSMSEFYTSKITTLIPKAEKVLLDLIEISEHILKLREIISELKEVESSLSLFDSRIAAIPNDRIFTGLIDYSERVIAIQSVLREIREWKEKVATLEDAIAVALGIEKTQQEELDTLLKSTAVCPFSNGEFFDSCKILLGRLS